MPDTIPFSLAATIGGALATAIAYVEMQRRSAEQEKTALTREVISVAKDLTSAVEDLIDRVERTP